jgi:hypothetical protein
MNYYGVPLSGNIARNDHGFVICKDAVIGRTGYQDYRVSQLSKTQLRDLGLLDRFNDPDEVVSVFRSPEEVFSDATIASFEGMTVTDNHPKDFVDSENNADLQRGHVQNIRRGDTPLSNGDLPMLGDIIITDPDLGEDVLQRRKRELSCGYTYKLAWDGNRLSQENIIGNHVAVVDRGRAGAEARINDSADIPQPKKEPMNILKHVFGLGLKAYAQDAKPEELADAVKECAADEDTKPEEKNAEDADPLAEMKDSLEGIADGMKSVSDRLDKLENPESKEESKDEDPKADEEPASEEEEAESEDEDEDEEAEDGKAEDAFIEPAVSESDLIKILKPLVARSNDAALKKAFNEAIANANDSVRGGSPKGAYGAVKSASEKKSAAANDSQDAQAAYITRLNEKAQAAWSGQKEVK